MPQTCTICRNDQKVEIDAALVDGSPIRDIAKRYELSKSALFRHRSHLPQMVIDAAGEEQSREALNIIAQLKAINSVSLAILKSAKDSKDFGLALKAIDRIQKQIELQSRLLGQIDDSPKVSIIALPMWINIRAQIVTALAAYPDARAALAKILLEMESTHAAGL